MPNPNVFLLYPGDREMRDRSDPAESRFALLFKAFALAGIPAKPAIYHDDFAEEVEEQLRGAALVLVWCNPIEGGRRRDRLDSMLGRLADAGTIVSAHPDAILKLGTKDGLFDARDLPFGSDVFRVESLAQLESELPERLRRGARVLKQHRGHSGNGVWRIERLDPDSPMSPRLAGTRLAGTRLDVVSPEKRAPPVQRTRGMMGWDRPPTRTMSFLELAPPREVPEEHRGGEH